ncbi:MAG: CAP domain-containing protein [Actinobacteria bacterium]|nr:CAP domain-containing protein [Actinomycetota bacterium]
MARALAVIASLAALAMSGVACTRVLAPTGQTVATAAATGPVATAREQQIALDLVARVNAEREARGEKPLVADSQLARRAFVWSEDMSQTGLHHSDLHPLLRTFVAAAENIGTGPRGTTAGALHVAWMRSDSHRHDLLAPNLDRIGIGVVCMPDGTMWATQEFASTRSGDFGPLPAAEPVARRDAGTLTC